MMSCKTCKHNRKRTIRNKTCLKNHMAVFGYGCKDYEKDGESNDGNGQENRPV